MEASGEPLSSACPTVETLRAFVIGKLAETDLEDIAEHLEHCSRCSSILLTFE